jgi:hypothetical protein
MASNLAAVVVVTLEEITDRNREAVLALRVAPGQEQFVSSVADSLAEAAAHPQARPWHRFRRGYSGQATSYVREFDDQFRTALP